MGISRLQGIHQLAQKLINIALPSHSEMERSVPVRSAMLKSGLLMSASSADEVIDVTKRNIAKQQGSFLFNLNVIWDIEGL